MYSAIWLDKRMSYIVTPDSLNVISSDNVADGFNIYILCTMKYIQTVHQWNHVICTVWTSDQTYLIYMEILIKETDYMKGVVSRGLRIREGPVCTPYTKLYQLYLTSRPKRRQLWETLYTRISQCPLLLRHRRDSNWYAFLRIISFLSRSFDLFVFLCVSIATLIYVLIWIKKT